jgi:hypothetical protein
VVRRVVRHVNKCSVIQTFSAGVGGLHFAVPNRNRLSMEFFLGHVHCKMLPEALKKSNPHDAKRRAPDASLCIDALKIPGISVVTGKTARISSLAPLVSVPLYLPLVDSRGGCSTSTRSLCVMLSRAKGPNVHPSSSPSLYSVDENSAKISSAMFLVLSRRSAASSCLARQGTRSSCVAHLN